MPDKIRLDILMLDRGLSASREKARGMIMAGEVSVNGQVVDKAGTLVKTTDTIVVKTKPRYVSRGGDKLAGALADFAVDVKGRICADVGASTGGFTDCLLQNAVACVYAIDVGYGLMAYELRNNPRVKLIERTNARYLEYLPEPVNLVVADASFISLKLLLPVIKRWLMPQADIIALIKPQFEAGKGDVGKGGVVRDKETHRRVLNEILEFAVETGFLLWGLTISPIKGPAGNIEFFVWLGWGEKNKNPFKVEGLIARVMGD